MTKEIKFSEDPELNKLPQFIKLKDIISEFYKIGIIERLSGNCVSAAELICNSCLQIGIPAKIIECQLAISKTHDDGRPEFVFIGYDNLNYQGQVDTHMVALVLTEIPMIIDASISYLLPRDRPVLVERADAVDPDVIGNFEFGDAKLTYTPKKIVRYPNLHQKNILIKALEEQKFLKEFSFFKLLVLGSLFFGFINFLANSSLLYIKMFIT
jgi:hypothetical protein